MASIRVSDVVRPFSGEGDIVQWIEKLEVVAKLREIKDVAALMPLFLEGPAFAVYCEMDPGKKADLKEIKRALTDAFGLNPFRAYEQLVRRVWREEPVDVYLSDLRRLAKVAGVESDEPLKRAFVVGLPPVVSRELRALAKVDSLSLPVIVKRARALVAEQELDLVAVCKNVQPSEKAIDDKRRKVIRCFRCDGPHLIRNCTMPSRANIVCWSCGGNNHIMRNFPQGNGNGKADAPVAFPETH